MRPKKKGKTKVENKVLKIFVGIFCNHHTRRDESRNNNTTTREIQQIRHKYLTIVRRTWKISFLFLRFLFGFVYTKIWPTKPNCQFLRLKKKCMVFVGTWYGTIQLFFHKWKIKKKYCLLVCISFLISTAVNYY